MDTLRRIGTTSSSNSRRNRRADWFIASDVRLAQDVGLSEIAFTLRNSRDGFTLWVENGAYRPRPIILLNVRCHADELVAALNKDGGGPTRFLLDLVNQHEIVIHLGRAKMYGGDNLAGDCLIPVDNGCTQRRSLRLEKLHRSLHILSRSSEHSGGELNQKNGSEGQQQQCERGLLHGYLPLASQHLDVKTIGRGGPLRRLFKSSKWTPLFACLSTLAGRSHPAAQCPIRAVFGLGRAQMLRPLYPPIGGHRQLDRLSPKSAKNRHRTALARRFTPPWLLDRETAKPALRRRSARHRRSNKSWQASHC